MSAVYLVFDNTTVSTRKCLFQIARQGWSGSGATLTSGLADLHQAVPRVGKNKHCEDAVFVLDFLLLRGVVFLLNTIFNKGEAT